MSFFQLNLNFWNPDYENDWIVGASNIHASYLVLEESGQILLCGPRFCGKKHLALKIAKEKNCKVFFINLMDDRKIIQQYDEQISCENEKAIWVNQENIESIFEHDSYITRRVSNDVCSRLNSMLKAEINEPSEDLLFPLLSSRLSNLGFVLRNEIINYCIYRMPRNYKAINDCVDYIKRVNKVSLKEFKDFFENNY